jgi:hypothetical protein
MICEVARQVRLADDLSLVISALREPERASQRSKIDHFSAVPYERFLSWKLRALIGNVISKGAADNELRVYTCAGKERIGTAERA